MTSREEFAEMLAEARELRLLRAVAEAAEAIYHQHHTDEGLLPQDLEWPELGAALKALKGDPRG